MIEDTATSGTIARAGRELLRLLENDDFAGGFGKRIVSFDPVSVPEPSDVAEMIWDILVATKFAPNGIRLAYRGEILHPPQKVIRGKPYIDPRALVDGLRIDRTMNVNGIERYRSDIREITTGLEDRFSIPCPANLYVSYEGSSGGYGPHRDMHDVIVLHLAGRKRWQIYPPRSSNVPIRRGAVSNEELLEPPVGVTLTSGSVLYVPAGFPHDVTSDDGCCVHVTFGISVLRWYDVLEALLQASDDAVLYERVPESSDEAASAAAARLMPRLLSLFAEDAMDRVIERSKGYSKLARLGAGVRRSLMSRGTSTER
jgi:hypothetical protein